MRYRFSIFSTYDVTVIKYFSYNGCSYVDFGRELSAQLRYYQRQMDGWQHIMTGEGEVTLEAPDGTQVTLSSFKKLTADVAGKADKAALDGKADKSELENKADKSALEGKLDKTGGTVTGALHVTHSVNVGDVDSGLIANGDGSVAFYAQDLKTGEWNTTRLHWVQNLEVGGNLTASGATFGGNVTISWGGRTATFHENGDVTGPIWGGELSGWLNNTFSKKIDDYGAIGSYVMAFCQAGNTGPNGEVQGTELRASTAGGNISGDPLPGKWRCMGNIVKKLNYSHTDFMSYSIDFRRRILSIKKHEGLSIRETAKRFHIGTTTIVRWTKQIDARPATSRQRKIDKSALERDVKQYPDAYQRERAERFGVCQMAICKALKKLQLTYKKNSASSKSRRRR